MISWRWGVLGFFVITIGVLAQEEPFRIRVDAAEVTVEAIVQDQNGRALTDLTQNDFEIYEDGQRQTMDYFASAETPRSILLVFDLSESTDSERPFMVQAVNGFLGSLRLQDRIAIAAFAEDFRTLVNWREAQGSSLELRLPPSQSLSNVYPALDKATRSFGDERARKGVIVMTDGRDTSFFRDITSRRGITDIAKDRDFQRLLQNLRKRSIPLYFIALNTDQNRTLRPNDQEYVSLGIQLGQAVADDYLVAVRTRLERLSEATGGRILFPRTLNDVVPLYEAIGRDLGLSYSMGYAPMNRADGKTHRIEVRVRRAGVKVTQSRESYVAR